MNTSLYAAWPLHVVVTGGAGFIGSHLTERLLKEGCRVTCIDNLYSGRKENFRRLEHEFDEMFHFIEHDVTSPIQVPGPVDRIYNLACPASPVYYQRDPVGTMLTSVLGSKNVLMLAAEKSARVLQASTSEVYGDPHVHPQPESYWGNVNPNGVRSCYDEGKRAAECMFFDFLRAGRADTRVARIFNTYGPRMSANDGRVVSNFIVQALKNEPITIYGAGNQTRSFCYVSDLVDGLIRLMEVDSNPQGAINLGNPVEFTMFELAQLVIRFTNTKSEIVRQPLPEDDPKQRQPIIARATQLLGWSPSVPLEEGLVKTVEYFRGLETKTSNIARIARA
jgi:UDP-glucuronate decarboxylase